MSRMRFVSYLLVLLLALLPLAAKDPVTDDHLYDRIRIQIANDREIGGHPIDVKVSNGDVELTGKVKTDKEKIRAEKVTKKVKGVKKVTNNIVVSPV